MPTSDNGAVLVAAVRKIRWQETALSRYETALSGPVSNDDEYVKRMRQQCQDFAISADEATDLAGLLKLACDKKEAGVIHDLCAVISYLPVWQAYAALNGDNNTFDALCQMDDTRCIHAYLDVAASHDLTSLLVHSQDYKALGDLCQKFLDQTQDKGFFQAWRGGSKYGKIISKILDNMSVEFDFDNMIRAEIADKHGQKLVRISELNKKVDKAFASFFDPKILAKMKQAPAQSPRLS